MYLIITLIWIFPYKKVNSQDFEIVTISSGNNQFWGFSSRQVENHTFEVRTRRNDSGVWTNPHSYLDTDCNYDGGDVQVAKNVSPTAQVNRLLLMPYTENDRADYINGVSTLDIWVIQRYIDNLSSLDNWQLTAANVNVNNVIDSNDINLIRDLVLAIRDDFGSGNRVSWGWVPHADVLTFLSESDPWVYALGYPGYWDVVFNNLSKNEITSSSANYFKFFAIKIGDVYATSTSGGNDWVCGTGGYGSYLREGNIVQTRSILHEGDKLGSVRLEKGDETTIEVQLKYLPEELGAIQLMLNIDHALAEVMDVQFIEEFQPYYHYRKDLNQLAMISYSKNAANPLDIKEGVLASITLRAKSTISDLDDMISWSERMENELIGMEANYIGGELELRIKDINRKSMIIDIHSGNGNPTAIIYSPENVKAQITITDVAGRRITSRSLTLQEGRNEMPLEQITDTGIYIFNLNTGQINQSQKFFNQ